MTFYLSYIFKFILEKNHTNLSCFLTYTNHLLPSEPWPSDDDGGDSDDDDGYGPDDEIEVTSTHQPVKNSPKHMWVRVGAGTQNGQRVVVDIR